jgi:hypothetical protein
LQANERSLRALEDNLLARDINSIQVVAENALWSTRGLSNESQSKVEEKNLRVNEMRLEILARERKA